MWDANLRRRARAQFLAGSYHLKYTSAARPDGEGLY